MVDIKFSNDRMTFIRFVLYLDQRKTKKKILNRSFFSNKAVYPTVGMSSPAHRTAATQH